MGIDAEFRETFTIYYLCEEKKDQKVDPEEFLNVLESKICS